MALAVAALVAGEGGEVHIGPGEFDLAGLEITLGAPVLIEGSGLDATILRNPGTIRLSEALTVTDLTFSGGTAVDLKANSPEGKTLQGLRIERCAFEDGTVAISTGKDPVGNARDTRRRPAMSFQSRTRRSSRPSALAVRWKTSPDHS
jgi:hypothetical protein